jgi:outer membrane protein OmpA-like peptidoglycan-associated protein
MSIPLIAHSQHYYVVVGAFAANENASEFRGYLPVRVSDTSYTVSEQDNLMHFFVFKTSDKESAVSKSAQLRQAIEGLKSPSLARSGPSPEVVVTGVLPEVKPDNAVENIETNASASSSASGTTGAAGIAPPKPVGKYFKFRVESPEGQPLTAQVHHVDLDNGREVAAYKSDTFVDLLQPGESHKPMTVICGMFGYKEIEKYIDYSDPSATDRQAYVDSQGVWVIPYKLERVEEGDVSVMNNVSFYKDAAVMRKSSLQDLQELVKMMHSNPYYEITIHSHCNGKAKREIIAPGSNKNYFDVDGSVKLMGTAKDLTTLRAEAIKSYLSDQGVDPSRVKIYSWGASDMLVKADSPHATFNDRIEIEFTRD